MATDGVTDNLFDDQIIEQCIKPQLSPERDLPRPEDAALCISMLAESVSYSKTLATPKTLHAVTNDRDHADELGGKPDDITVIVAQIKLKQ